MSYGDIQVQGNGFDSRRLHQRDPFSTQHIASRAPNDPVERPRILPTPFPRRWMLATLLACACALAGCGVVEGVAGTVTGVVVREHETDHLVCATAIAGEAVSVSCVPKAPSPPSENR